MKYWFRGKFIGLLVYGLIGALVAGGLGWVTRDALSLEQEKHDEHADREYLEQVRLALWKLDSRVSPVLAREDSRPYNHFSAVYAPSVALQRDGKAWPTGTVLELSPLIGAELPDWVVVHFQADASSGWVSPQVLSTAMARRLHAGLEVVNKGDAAGAERADALRELSAHLKPQAVLSRLRAHDEPPRQENTTVMLANPLAMNQAPAYSAQQSAANDQPQQKLDPEFLSRAGQQNRVKQEVNPKAQNDDQSVALANTCNNGESWFSYNPKRVPHSEQVAVGLGTLVPLWLSGDDGRERLLLARMVRIGDKRLCQGLLLDWRRLQETLGQEVKDLFPDARFEPVREGLPENPERAMTLLPVEMDPGPRTLPEFPTWTPLRVGLSLAWAAALVALLAVGLGGWTLLELSERRIRFVSAVTHELRTPLTTLRLYLDMLTGGMVHEEKQRTEYLQTLHAETERLNRLVGNVLDFSRLENQRPKLEKSSIAVADLLEQVRSSWQGRCDGCEKLLIVEDRTPPGFHLKTDVRLVPQVLGNLIDNACKYSHGADDRRIWLRATSEGSKLILEVEDRGPGVPSSERRSIFRAFRRGNGTETTGGVGLGLALAKRWARLLGGKLVLRPVAEGVGACFRLELPKS